MQAVGWAEDQGRRPEMEDGFVFVDQAGRDRGCPRFKPREAKDPTGTKYGGVKHRDSNH